MSQKKATPIQQRVKARIVLATYDGESDTVRYECVLENGEPYYLHWPAAEYGPKVVGANIDFPRDLLVEHCQELSETQKELEIVINDIPSVSPEQAKPSVERAASVFSKSMLSKSAQEDWLDEMREQMREMLHEEGWERHRND